MAAVTRARRFVREFRRTVLLLYLFLLLFLFLLLLLLLLLLPPALPVATARNVVVFFVERIHSVKGKKAHNITVMTAQTGKYCTDMFRSTMHADIFPLHHCVQPPKYWFRGFFLWIEDFENISALWDTTPLYWSIYNITS